MKRRDFLRGAGAVAAGSIAGCTGSGDDENPTDEGLPSPEERDYRAIDHGDLPSDIDGTAAATEELVDETVFEDYSGTVERSSSYLDVQENGSRAVTREMDEEQVEQDLYGFNIDLEAEGELDAETAQEIAVDAFESFMPLVHQELDYSEAEIPDEEVISEVSLNIKAENGYGNVTYGDIMNSPEGKTTDDLKLSTMEYLEEGPESTALEEEIRDDFFYDTN